MAKKQKKTNKAHQRIKRIKRMLVGICIESWDSWYTGDPDAPTEGRIWHKRTGQRLTVDDVELVKKFDLDWRVKIMVRCNAPDVTYIEEREVLVDNIKLNQLTPIYERMKKEAQDACNPQHIVSTGWKAEVLGAR